MLRSQDASRGEVIMKNAIILAAGKSNRFAPFTYERPKALFSVKGEILIERQIKQLREANVKDIYIVVGYMKENFFGWNKSMAFICYSIINSGKRVIYILCIWQDNI